MRRSRGLGDVYKRQVQSFGLAEGPPVAVSKPQQFILYPQGCRESPKGI
jgi:hypothetical protein